MRRIQLLTCTLFLLAVCVPIPIPISMPAPEGRQSIDPPDVSALESQLHARVNAYRIDRNLPPLQLNGFLSSLARDHSGKMADGERPFGHDGFEARADAAQEALGVQGMSENVATNNYAATRVVDAVVSGWISSSGHRQNLAGDYDIVGVGIARARDGTYFITQVYADGGS